MAKYKPKLFEFKEGTLATDIYKIVGLSFKMNVFTCGNCNNLITISRTDTKPIRCKKCGNDIDWVGIYRKQIKTCPQCGRTAQRRFRKNVKGYDNTTQVSEGARPRTRQLHQDIPRRKRK
jgi:rRNA maturation endonuclease Nob1